MAVPFGFSIGDFIAVGDLVRKVANALSESRGSTAAYKSLCELLFSLDRSLQVASAIFLYSSSSTGSSIDHGPLNGICHELDICRRLMEDFLTCSRKYTEALLNGQGSRVKREWRKVTWCLYKDDDVQRLRDSLKGHIDAFSLYLTAVTRQTACRTEQKTIEASETIHRTEQMVVKISDTGHRGEAMMTQMLSLLKVVHDDMPKVMGYAWESEKPILLEDALGRVVPLPLVLCSTKDVFHDILKAMFKGRPGQKRIAENQYEIVEGSEGALIQDVDWESKILPGVRVSMGIIIVIPTRPPDLSKLSRYSGERRALQYLDQISHVCPRCNTPNPGATPTKGSLKCRKCDLIFQALATERIVEELPETPPETHSGLPTNSKSSLAHQALQQKEKTHREIPREPKEEEVFRRIHYRREVSKYPASRCGWDCDGCEYKSPKERAFLKAAAEGDLEKVRLFISNLVEINLRGECTSGRTALQGAAEHGHLEIVKLLLSHSADVNAKPAERFGLTALQAAAEGGHLEIVKLLLSHSADVNAKPAVTDGRTALQAAAGRGHLEIVKPLLSHSADVNSKPAAHGGLTALQAAAEGGHLEIAKLLLSHSADVNAKPAEQYGRTALQAAAERGHLETMKLLLSYSADVNAKLAADFGRTALQAAAERGHLEIVKLLLSYSADVNAKRAEHGGLTALQAATLGGHLEIVKLLLSHSADVNPKLVESDGLTALQEAAFGGHLEIVKLLLSHSADVNAEPAKYSGLTALQAAAYGGHLEIVKLLLSHSADVNAEPAEDDGRTALQAAAFGGHLEIVKLLLSHSADVNAKPAESDGLTALQAAAGNGHLEIQKLLLLHSTNVLN